MFNKLTFEQMATFYGAVATLEKEYGTERVIDGMKAMAEVLDGAEVMEEPSTRIGFKELQADIKEAIIKDEQLELLPNAVAKVKAKRKGAKRNRPGLNDELIKKYFSLNINNPEGKHPSEMILKMYYKDRLTQRQIGDKIGICQRAVGMYISNIPVRFKNRILAQWEMTS